MSYGCCSPVAAARPGRLLRLSHRDQLWASGECTRPGTTMAANARRLRVRACFAARTRNSSSCGHGSFCFNEMRRRRRNPIRRPWNRARRSSSRPANRCRDRKGLQATQRHRQQSLPLRMIAPPGRQVAAGFVTQERRAEIPAFLDQNSATRAPDAHATAERRQTRAISTIGRVGPSLA
jgi:hypothetical protein